MLNFVLFQSCDECFKNLDFQKLLQIWVRKFFCIWNTVNPFTRTDARVWWATRRTYPRKRPKTKEWPYDSVKHRQRVHLRKKDVRPDAKGRRCGRCEERQRDVSKDACLRTKQGMYSRSTAYHQKLSSKCLSGTYALRHFEWNRSWSFWSIFQKKKIDGKIVLFFYFFSIFNKSFFF